MTSRRRRAAAILIAAPLADPGRGAEPATFVGSVTDTEYRPDHAPLIVMGGMGKGARECTYRCVEKGATLGS